MDLDKVPFFSLINKRLTWLAQRQDVLAQNIANVDTPGYKERDLPEASFADLVKGVDSRLQMVATSPHHIGGASGPDRVTPVVDRDAQPTLNGNSVDVESELLKVSKTGVDYQFAINLYKKQIGFIKTALGRPSGS
jgi:flagellar basal-body rod protein FlgB